MEKRKFDYQLLQSRCNEYNIKLLKDYPNEKLNKLTIIEGECINYDICKNTFSKTFTSFSDNAKCTNCNKKYSYTSLISFCKDNNMELLEDYSKKKLTQHTTIKGKCINYDECKGIFSKQYMALLDNQCCSNCAKDNKFTYSNLITFCKENNIELLHLWKFKMPINFYNF